MRALLLGVCLLVLRIFFRRIEIVGHENVPKTGPVVFIVNHPNGLLDPLFVLCLSGRRVSLLAKEPLFRMPFVGYFVRTFECLPVYRRSDGADPAKNRAVLDRARELLRRGNAIALFPEGTSHSDPSLKPLRHGAARLALSASSPSASLGSAPEPVCVVAVGLYYAHKSAFRSSALVTIGPPLETPRVELGPDLSPSARDTEELTEELTQRLAAVTLQARTTEAMRLAQHAERILRAAEKDDAFLQTQPDEVVESTLARRLSLRQRLIDGYEHLVVQHGPQVHVLADRIESYQSKLARIGFRVEQRVLFTTREVLAASLGALLVVVLLFPIAIAGFVVSYPTYLLIDYLAFRVSRGEDDVLATVKAVGGVLLFPLTWILASVALLASVGPWAAGAALVLCPVCAYAALVTMERTSHALAQSYVVWALLVRPGLRRWVVEERREIRRLIYELGDALDAEGRTAR